MNNTKEKTKSKLGPAEHTGVSVCVWGGGGINHKLANSCQFMFGLY